MLHGQVSLDTPSVLTPHTAAPQRHVPMWYDTVLENSTLHTYGVTGTHVPPQRSHHSAVTVEGNTVLIFGGVYSNAHEIYSERIDQVGSCMVRAPEACHGLCVCYVI